jgi:hypothetical protein
MAAILEKHALNRLEVRCEGRVRIEAAHHLHVSTHIVGARLAALWNMYLHVGGLHVR